MTGTRAIVLTQRALKGLQRLDGALQRRVSRVLFLLSRDSEHPSLRTERIEGAGRDRFEVRVDSRHRAVVEARNGAFHVLLVGGRDVAYARGPLVSSPPDVDLTAATETYADSMARVADIAFPPLFDVRLRDALLHLGVPHERVDDVLACTVEDELIDLGLDDVVCDRLFDALDEGGGPLQEIHPGSEEELAEAVSRSVPFRWKLTDEHRALVSRTLDGPLLIRGSAGTGKTTVAVHRAMAAARQPELFEQSGRAPVLLLCYNRHLARHLRAALFALRGSSAGRVEVTTIDEWCTGYLRSRNSPLGVLRPEDGQGLIRDALRRIRRRGSEGDEKVLVRSPEFFYEEIQQVIEGRMALNFDAYRSMRRVGRRFPLDEGERFAVWEVYREYRSLLETLGGVDLDGLAFAAREQMDRDADPPRYRTVIVDEAQDFSPARLSVCTRLAEGKRVVFLADAAQNIYRPGFQWKDLGLSLMGRTEVLSRNLRQSALIHAFVRAIGESIRPERDEGDDEALRHTPHVPSPKAGQEPTVVICRGLEEEIDYAVQEVRRQLENVGRRPGEIGVLALKNRVVLGLARRMRREGIPVRTHLESREAEPLAMDAVRVMTCDAGKGLDIPVVLLVDVNQGAFPSEGEELDVRDIAVREERSRRVLYVACSRAGEELFLTCTSGEQSPFLEEIDGGTYRQRVWPAEA